MVVKDFKNLTDMWSHQAGRHHTPSPLLPSALRFRSVLRGFTICNFSAHIPHGEDADEQDVSTPPLGHRAHYFPLAIPRVISVFWGLTMRSANPLSKAKTQRLTRNEMHLHYYFDISPVPSSVFFVAAECCGVTKVCFCFALHGELMKY